MTPHARARILAGALTGLWVLMVVLAWLLLPQILGITGGFLIVWFAALWIPAVVIGCIPFVVATVFEGR